MRGWLMYAHVDVGLRPAQGLRKRQRCHRQRHAVAYEICAATLVRVLVVGATGRWRSPPLSRQHVCGHRQTPPPPLPLSFFALCVPLSLYFSLPFPFRFNLELSISLSLLLPPDVHPSLVFFFLRPFLYLPRSLLLSFSSFLRHNYEYIIPSPCI